MKEAFDVQGLHLALHSAGNMGYHDRGFRAYRDRNSGQSEYPSQKVDLHNVIAEVIAHVVTRVTNRVFPRAFKAYQRQQNVSITAGPPPHQSGGWGWDWGVRTECVRAAKCVWLLRQLHKVKQIYKN